MKLNRIALLISLTLIWACNIEKEESGELPEVDVDVAAESGELPEYDINWADVDVGTRKDTIEVPKVVVVMEEEAVEVPYIDVDVPNETEKEERQITVEVEVSGQEHELEIQEVWATGNQLYVISELEQLDTSLEDQTMRVSDQININAPDLSVRHYIVGDQPEGNYNTQHTFVSSKDELDARVGDHRVIYTE